MFIAKILLLCAVGALASAKPQRFFGFFGGPQKLEGQELVDAQKKLQASLEKLDADEGPHYRISRILSALLKSGSINSYSVELIDRNGATKVCNVDIWSQTWLPDGILVIFRCPNEPELTKKIKEL